MDNFVYLLLTKTNNRYISYVGFTNNLENRLKKHNNSKGAKFTRGKTWKIIYSKKYKSKSEGLKEEYKLKKNYKLRKHLKDNYLLKNEKTN